MLLDTVAGEAVNELNFLSSMSDQKQPGRTVPSLIHKNGPKEMNASINKAALDKDRQFLGVGEAYSPKAGSQWEDRQVQGVQRPGRSPKQCQRETSLTRINNCQNHF